MSGLEGAAPPPPEAGPGHRLQRPGGLVSAVVRSLIDRVNLGEFRPGDVLPNEGQLGSEFGVSRPVVREALRALAEKGLITVRQGRGTVVNEREDWDLIDPEVLAALVAHDRSPRLFSQLVRIRAAVEAELARSATDLMSDAERLVLQSLFDELERSKPNTSYYALADRAFHDHIMRTSGNPFGRVIVRKVSAWSRTAPRPLGDDPREIELAHRGHQRVFDAILRGDAAEAGEQMREHILSSWEMRLGINST
jgi:GntR family transcriptional regulator, galactonate operon transcriptional repressor